MPQVLPPRRSQVTLPPLETQLQPPAGFRAVPPVSISLPASPGSLGVPTPTDSGDLRRQAMMASAARGPHRLAAQDKGSNSVRFTEPDREAMISGRSRSPARRPSASPAGPAAAAPGPPGRR